MIKTRKKTKIYSSFRDPSGFLFKNGDDIYRQVNVCYKENYDHLIKSGLYDFLIKENLLVPHKEVDKSFAFSSRDVYKIIKPYKIPFISYPYEWCFSQLRVAALATLKIQRIALEFGMSLKDSSVYNVQFLNGNPIFIDTLSFEKYKTGKPWIAYRQFCQHFLAPLALMKYKDVRTSQLLKTYIDGIPLDLASKILPTCTKFSFPILFHIHFHAKTQKRFSDKDINKKFINKKVSANALVGIIDSLEKFISRIRWRISSTEWSDYYSDDSYSQEAFNDKKRIVNNFLSIIQPKNVLDLGANIGVFSRLASDKGIMTISCDNDPLCVERNYLNVSCKKEKNILPLLIDLTNPSPGIGWQNKERESFIKRCDFDCVFALALVHHLAISNNLPFSKIADFFSKITNFLIIEFIPKDDKKTQKLLSFREDIFSNYDQKNFEAEFGKIFNIKKKKKIQNSHRVLYLMERR